MPLNSPTHAEIHELVSLFNKRRFGDAGRLAHAMTQQHPGFGLGWKVLGAALRQDGQAQAALGCLQKAVALSPQDAEARSNMGNVLMDLGRLDEAIASHQQAVQLQPDFAPAHNNLGNVWRQRGQLANAEASYRSALALNPGHVQAMSNLGLTLKDQQRLAEARDILLKATQLDPGFAQAWGHLGVTLTDMGCLAEAEAAFAQAIRLDPQDAYAHTHLGVALRNMARLAEAQASLQRAIAIAPDHAQAHNTLGAVLNDLGMPEAAMACYRRALALDGHYFGAITNLATTLTSLGHFEEGLRYFEQALQLKPGFREAHDNLLFALNYHPDMPAPQIYSAYQRFDQLLGAPLLQTAPAAARPASPSRRLRVGYLSPDLRRHSCRHFVEPLLANHDQAAFEVFAYSELAHEDDVTQGLKRHCAHWLTTWGMTDEALAQRVRDDGIDILVDLAGHTAGNRLAVFARKPAPVSVSWLGYGYTTGLRAIDHFLTDWHMAPSGSESLFSESPWRLGRVALAYRPTDAMGPVSPLPAQQRGYVTFGSFTRAIRINHHTVRVWSALLKRVANARLVVDSRDFHSPQMQQQLLARFAAHGIAADRLSIGHHSPPWDLMRDVDICLDCFPHNSGTTLLEGLYMGLPFVTLAGRASVGLLGSAILQGLGRPEWIARTEDEYIHLASTLAMAPDALAEIRSGLRASLKASPLMDETGFARQVENAYRQMWHQLHT